jgi:hypothetical protein
MLTVIHVAVKTLPQIRLLLSRTTANNATLTSVRNVWISNSKLQTIIISRKNIKSLKSNGKLESLSTMKTEFLLGQLLLLDVLERK